MKIDSICGMQFFSVQLAISASECHQFTVPIFYHYNTADIDVAFELKKKIKWSWKKKENILQTDKDKYE